MKMYFDHFHGFARSVVPDFGVLRAEHHRVDPRAASSVVVACMTLAMALMVTMTLTEPVRRAPATSAGKVAPPPAAGKVTIVAATPGLDVPNLNVPCAEQTWPYIDRRCLTETTQKRPQPEKATATPAPADTQKAAMPAETQGAVMRDAPALPQADARHTPLVIDTSEAAELAEDDDIPHPLPSVSEQELRHFERMERQRALQERRMRQPQFHLPLFGRIF